MARKVRKTPRVSPFYSDVSNKDLRGFKNLAGLAWTLIQDALALIFFVPFVDYGFFMRNITYLTIF